MSDHPSSCTAVLTRGYGNIYQYWMLIKRNNHIYANLKCENIDHLIFHEGNIVPEHQQYIQSQTPNLPLQFINISNTCFLKEKEMIQITHAFDFDMKYRHMCHFWFIDFLKITRQYDKLLRIDEDCFVESPLANIFTQLDTSTFVSATVFPDQEFVTVGLNEFSLNFVNKHKLPLHSNKREPHGPYTNLIGFNLKKIRENVFFQVYLNEIDASEKIYERRWGDLPLWGEVIYYIFGENTMKIDKTITYFHQSHQLKIN